MLRYGAVTPTPFTIHVPDAILADLRSRLERGRWPDEVPAGGWRYGTELSYLKSLVEYWRDKYDWRSQEAALNRWRQFTVAIDGIDLHFVHEPGVGPAPLPLLLSHGWPGSIVEFQRLIPLLTDPGAFRRRPVPTPSRWWRPRCRATPSVRANQPRDGVGGRRDLRRAHDARSRVPIASQPKAETGAAPSFRGWAMRAQAVFGIRVNLVVVRRAPYPSASPIAEELRIAEERRHR